jgi:hypothetical protein
MSSENVNINFEQISNVQPMLSLAVLKDTNADRPKHLAKTVTV